VISKEELEDMKTCGEHECRKCKIDAGPYSCVERLAAELEAERAKNEVRISGPEMVEINIDEDRGGASHRIIWTEEDQAAMVKIMERWLAKARGRKQGASHSSSDYENVVVSRVDGPLAVEKFIDGMMLPGSWFAIGRKIELFYTNAYGLRCKRTFDQEKREWGPEEVIGREGE
jgi:hypothetical protein